MDIWHSLAGMVSVELTSADISASLEKIQQEAVVLWDIETVSPLQFRFRIRRGDLKKMKSVAAKRGDALKVLRISGLFTIRMLLRKRPILVFGCALLLAISLWVPGRIFFVQVEGNTTIPEQLILEKAQDCGIGFGVSRRAIRSEKLKNNLLRAMPELQWAGVNTYGCLAVITVRERSIAEERENTSGIGNIVASRDAIIEQITVQKGTALCKPGQAVTEGQILVSGYTDCGLYIQAGSAEGEVYGSTHRDLTALFPTTYVFRGEKTGVTKKYSLILGKKRINFSKDSGILGSTCAKIESDYNLMLPGGFLLPVSLVVESYYSYDSYSDTFSSGEGILDAFSRAYMLEQMIAGKIDRATPVYTQSEGVLRLDGSFDCTEMIGLLRTEEYIYGKIG